MSNYISPLNPPWLHARSSGLLLHLTSLPGDLGIGNLGSCSRVWLDFLKECGQTSWQFCPVGPTSPGVGNSPYSSFSAYAGNPLLIDLSALVMDGLLNHQDLDPLRRLPQHWIDYDNLTPIHEGLLEKAFNSFLSSKKSSVASYGKFSEYQKREAYWLDDYCLYQALKKRYEQSPWWEWPKTARDISKARKRKLTKEDQHYVQFHAFQQYIFDAQWNLLREAAEEKGIKLIGDAPIFVSHDSADTWANPDIFALNKDGSVELRAGVPPDYFAELGQLWGNPVYRWDELKKRKYDWWLERIRRDFSRYDWLRLDHFRAFHDYWAIPVEAEDARTGTWKPGPGIDFFNALKNATGVPSQLPIIAEDLGDMGQDVFDLRDAVGLPGMKVLQFAFASDPGNPHLPHNFYTANCVVYPGTHDNDTSAGWYDNGSDFEKHNFRRYLSVDGSSPSWDLIRAACASTARLAIYSMQDILSLGTEARFNTPGVASGNWDWRCTVEQLNLARSESAAYLKELTTRFGRHPEPSPCEG